MNNKKQYYVKIGKLYISQIDTDTTDIKTYFIYNLKLNSVRDNAYIFEEDEQPKLIKILKDVLELENEYTEITFEEVEENE